MPARFVILQHLSQQTLVEVFNWVLDHVDAHRNQREADHDEHKKQQHVALWRKNGNFFIHRTNLCQICSEPVNRQNQQTHPPASGHLHVTETHSQQGDAHEIQRCSIFPILQFRHYFCGTKKKCNWLGFFQYLKNSNSHLLKIIILGWYFRQMFNVQSAN